MNIHPAFVHFPIALLLIYSLIELLPMARFMPRVGWSSIKPFLLYLGTAAALVTAATGGMAEELVGESPKIGAHEAAAWTMIAAYVLACLATCFWKGDSGSKRTTLRVLAALGLVMLFVVGALGANIVYGPAVDPIVSFVTAILGVQ